MRSRWHDDKRVNWNLFGFGLVCPFAFTIYFYAACVTCTIIITCPFVRHGNYQQIEKNVTEIQL